jgi:hypothetical protein
LKVNRVVGHILFVGNALFRCQDYNFVLYWLTKEAESTCVHIPIVCLRKHNPIISLSVPFQKKNLIISSLTQYARQEWHTCVLSVHGTDHPIPFCYLLWRYCHHICSSILPAWGINRYRWATYHAPHGLHHWLAHTACHPSPYAHSLARMPLSALQPLLGGKQTRISEQQTTGS